MRIKDLLFVINDEQKIEIGSDWKSVKYQGTAKDCNPSMRNDELYSIMFKLVSRIFINENDVLRIEYHVYDSHACPKSNYVADLGLGYISPYDILLAVENENVLINGNRAGHFVANQDLITTKITDLKVVNGQLHWEWKSIFY